MVMTANIVSRARLNKLYHLYENQTRRIMIRGCALCAKSRVVLKSISLFLKFFNIYSHETRHPHLSKGLAGLESVGCGSSPCYTFYGNLTLDFDKFQHPTTGT